MRSEKWSTNCERMKVLKLELPVLYYSLKMVNAGLLTEKVT